MNGFDVPRPKAVNCRSGNYSQKCFKGCQQFVRLSLELPPPAILDPMKGAGCEVVYVLADPVRPTLPSIALEYRLPSVYRVNSYSEIGGLMSYGPDIHSLFVNAAVYVDRILKGGNSAEIRVEQPTQFVFAINLRTEKTLGLTIPERVLVMADKVIE